MADELIIDKERYKKHPECDVLVCFVYDPSDVIRNPVGLEDDLAQESGPKCEVVVLAEVSHLRVGAQGVSPSRGRSRSLITVMPASNMAFSISASLSNRSTTASVSVIVSPSADAARMTSLARQKMGANLFGFDITASESESRCRR
ncbi:MAG: hypothetical protein IPM35_33595 [Myxococcales bacterium]|nr:hypothetical protein [Myxococcales bacterium]